MIRLGVIGCGHWGPNHIRIFSQTANSQVIVCADLDEDRLKSIKALFPTIRTTKDYREILQDPDIDAVCIASPTSTHFQFTKEALEHGKHVLCEKPLALLPEECLKLKELSAQKQKLLMVGHIFVFNQGIMRLKEYIKSGELGRSVRIRNVLILGISHDVNALGSGTA